MPASRPAPGPASYGNPVSPADQALAAIADRLGADGYGSAIPAWEGDAFLRTTNAIGAHVALTITSHGDVNWEYRSAECPHLHLSRLAGIAIAILDPDRTRPEPIMGTNDGFPLAEIIRFTLHRYGFTAVVTGPDDGTGHLYLLTAANPAQPYRGTIYITDDGDLQWHARAPHHLDGGIPLPDIAKTITRALTRAQHTPV